MAAGRKRDPRERAEDGAARDPAAFQQSIRDDPGLMAELEGNPEAQKVLLGGDLNAMQDYLRSMHRVRETSPRPSCPPSRPARARPLCPSGGAGSFVAPGARFHASASGGRLTRDGRARKASVNEALDQANRSSDAQRVDATVPRDSVQLYRKLHSMGLQYGPAFQLLQTVRVPEDFGAE